MPGLKGWGGGGWGCWGEERERERGRIWICKEFELPTGTWPSATAIAPVSLTDESYRTCQDCMSASAHTEQQEPWKSSCFKHKRNREQRRTGDKRTLDYKTILAKTPQCSFSAAAVWRVHDVMSCYQRSLFMSAGEHTHTSANSQTGNNPISLFNSSCNLHTGMSSTSSSVIRCRRWGHVLCA